VLAVRLTRRRKRRAFHPSAPPAADVQARRAQRLWEKLQSVVGFFELDPNRTLDVVLDAFLPHLLTHHRFFLALLACSPWAAPAPMASPSSSSSAAAAADVNAPGQDLAGERGRAVVAQILGFKFRFYQGQEVLREGKTTPSELYLLAGLLIREGVVRLRELWPHLSPAEAEVDRLEARWRSAVNDKARSSRGNAMLAAAAALDDDDGDDVGKPPRAGGSSSSGGGGGGGGAAEPPAGLPAAALALPEQKLPLVHALLVVGAHGQAAHLLGRLPHLVQADRAIADLVLRQLEHVLRPLFAAHPSTPSPPAGANRPGPGVPKPAPKLTLIAPEPIASRSTRFVGFCPEWAAGLDPVGSLDALFPAEGKPIADTSALGLLRLLGAQLSRRKDILVRLVRLGRAAVAEVRRCRSPTHSLPPSRAYYPSSLFAPPMG